MRWGRRDGARRNARHLSLPSISVRSLDHVLVETLAHTRKGVTAVYARWDKFDLRREMALVIERSLRETLDDKPEAAIQSAA